MSSPARMYAYDAPSGNAGARATVRIMADWLRKRVTGGDHSPEDLDATERLRTRARELFVGLAPLDDLGEIARVWQFITENVRYMPDNLGTEHVTDPAELDRQIDEGTAAEDCESIELYAATLFAISGRRSQWAIIAKDPTRPDDFSHCSMRTEVRRPSRGWMWFDPVGHAYYPQTFGLGDSVLRAGEAAEFFDLDGEKITMGQKDDVFNAMLGDAGQDAANIFDSIANAAAGAGPYGQLIGGAIKAGEGIAAAAGSSAAKNALTKGASAQKTAEDKAKAAAKAGASWWAQRPTWQKLLIGVGVVGGVAYGVKKLAA